MNSIFAETLKQRGADAEALYLRETRLAPAAPVPRCRRHLVGIVDHPDAAEVSPCLPDWVAPTALHERCRSHKELCLEMLAVGHEVGHKDKHLRCRWRWFA